LSAAPKEPDDSSRRSRVEAEAARSAVPLPPRLQAGEFRSLDGVPSRRSDQIATHQQPPDADFLVHADLEPHGMAGAREQLWVKQVDERRFVMRSLPYFTYGIALGDEVSTDEALTIDDVMRRSGHRLLRVAVECDAAERFNQEAHPFLDHERLLHEWRGLGYVAIDLPPRRALSRLTEWLDPRAGGVASIRGRLIAQLSC
jgi:hypothetical protein